MNEYNFNVKFEKGRISSNLKKLVQNDYNSTKINFTFDREGRKLFKMLYPDGSTYITQIDNDELLFGVGVLSQDGTYEVEIALYTEDGRLTDYATTKFDVRAELIQSDEIVELDDRLPILDSLINDVQGVKTEIEDAIQYATEQGDYAKEQANRNFDAIEEATKIVDNFEENVNEYKENFDNNADLKTNDFNSNVDEKTTIFDNHVIDGIDTFNTNATTKLNEYNTNSSSKLEEYNTNATAKLKEYNANADGLMTIAVDTRNELERIKNDVLETGEASGNYLTLNDSTMAEYQELEVDGVCEQVTTTGKNLLDFETYQTRTPVNTWIEIIKDGNPFIDAGTYSFSCTGEFGSRYILWTRSASGNIHNVANNSSFEVTEEQLNSITSIKLVIEGVTSGTTYKGNIYPMIEKGNVVTEYEPYTGGKATPRPDYPQEITVIENELKVVSCAKSLFDGELIQGSFNGSGNNARCFNKNNIFLEKGEYILLSDLDIEKYKFGILLSTNQFPTNDTNWLLDSGWLQLNEYTFKVETECYFGINIASLNGTDLINPSMFESNKFILVNTNLLTQINANLGNEFVGKINDNVKDRLRVSYNEEDGEYHLYLDKNIGKIVLDGTQIINNINSSLENTTRVHYKNVLEQKVLAYSVNKYSLSNRLIYKTNWEHDFEGFYFDDNSKDLTFRINKSIIGKTKEEINTWLSENPIEIYYKFSESYTLDLGVIDMPISYDEVTNLFTDSDLIPIINAKYYRNFTETVRNLQINNDTLKNELASIENRLSALESLQVSAVNESEVVE